MYGKYKNVNSIEEGTKYNQSIKLNSAYNELARGSMREK